MSRHSILLYRACVFPIYPESLLHFKLLHNGMLGIVVLGWIWLPRQQTHCTGSNKSMGIASCCSLCHLFIHPATISTHQEYLPIFKTIRTPPSYPYCSSYWEIKICLTVNHNHLTACLFYYSRIQNWGNFITCLLYTSDAADE